MSNQYSDGQENPQINVTVQQEPLTEKNLPPYFSPLGAWAYFWLEVLFLIPVIGFIFTIVFACGAGGNIHLRNFARSRFCIWVLLFIVAAIIFAIVVAGRGVFGAFGSNLSSFFSQYF